MKKLKGKELLNLSLEELDKRLLDLRSEYSRLKAMAARGAVKKETGVIKSVRRNIARLETARRLKLIGMKREVKQA
ncbi:MAG: 50S ribosomal protein L29 [Nitrososphaeria archaeon]